MSIVSILASKILLLMVFNQAVFGQNNSSDTTKVPILPDVEITDQKTTKPISTPLEPISGTYIHDGKKSEAIQLDALNVNLTDKIGRQLFSTTPGVFVYDFDGTGNQINISVRGLDSHRGWELNQRKDGIVTNSDMYAYPASHYSVPLESIERIELIRGTASLQYGAQFGGMLNYVTKQPDTSKNISFENYTALGSYKLLSSYNAIGGKVGRLKYYAYLKQKTRAGFRNHELTNYSAEGVILSYALTPKLSLKAEWARSYYLFRSPGPLTDAMFHTNPTQATRFRNYYSPTIHVPSLHLKWQILAKTYLEYISSAVLGTRKSVLFDKPATVPDTINALSLQFNPRQVDIDQFNSITNELRILQKYNLRKRIGHISFGIQVINNHLHRLQQGQGTTGTDYNLILIHPTWGRNVHLKTQNLAFCAENNLLLTDKLSINIGTRYELGNSRMRGTIRYYASDRLPLDINRNFQLFGSSFNYQYRKTIAFYGGIAQNYRPIIFKELIPTEAYEKVNPHIQDAFGYNAEVGCRGSYRGLTWDLTAFALRYNNRFGTILQTDTDGQFFTHRTNIGHSLTRGLEVFLQGRWPLKTNLTLTVFTATVFIDGRYTTGMIKSGNQNLDLTNRQIESTPSVISRNTIALNFSRFDVGLLHSFVGQTFADPLNTLIPSPSGSVGVIPAYNTLDFSCSIYFYSNFIIKINMNNLFNTYYFTKRPLMYPGPGVWPSDGRNGTILFIIKI